MKPAMLFIINPNAGHSGVRAALMDILSLFNTRYEVRVYITSGPKETTELITAEGSRYDLITVSGGDGTLNEAVSGLMALKAAHSEEDFRLPLLGYIPAGTVNDMAYSLGLSLDAMQAAKDIINGEPFAVDAGSFNGRTYTYVAAFGAFTKVSYATPAETKHVLGRLAYLLEGAKSLGDIKPIHAAVTVDGETLESDFILGSLCSTSSMGGFHMKKPDELDISLNDGLSEVIFVRAPKVFTELGTYLVEAAQMDFSNPEHFFTAHTSSLRVEFNEDVPWTVDGEDGGSCRVADLNNIHNAYQILVPKK